MEMDFLKRTIHNNPYVLTKMKTSQYMIAMTCKDKKIQLTNKRMIENQKLCAFHKNNDIESEEFHQLIIPTLLIPSVNTLHVF